MDIPPPQVKNLDNISNHLRTVVKDTRVHQTVFQSMDGLIRTLTALLDENGKPGWTLKALNEDNQPIFNVNEGQQFEQKIQPFIPMILKFFDKMPTLKGGNGAMMTKMRLDEIKSKMGNIQLNFKNKPTQEMIKEYTELYNELSSNVTQMENDKDADYKLYTDAKAYFEKVPNPSTFVLPPTPSPPTTAQVQQGTVNELQKEVAQLKAEKTTLQKKLQSLGIDENFSLDKTVLDTVKKIYKMDEATQKFATENFGILKFEHEYDIEDGGKGKDPHPFEILRPVPYIGPFLAEVPVPARLLIMIVYTIIDISRVMISVAPVDSPFIRSLLSILLGLADFLKGSWKKAILSFAGVFGQNYVLAGVVGKMFLDVIGLIGPDLQLKIALGTVDLIKSLVAGLLLQIYQITALAPMRQSVIEGFEEIADLVKSNKEKLASAENLPEGEDALPNFLIPSFINIQNIQAVVAHDALVCTTQFQKAIDKMLTDAQGNKNIIMRFILEFLLRVPIDPTARGVRCKGMPQQKDTPKNTDQSGEVNVNNPVDLSGQQTYTQTALKASQEYTGQKP